MFGFVFTIFFNSFIEISLYKNKFIVSDSFDPPLKLKLLPNINSSGFSSFLSTSSFVFNFFDTFF
jgi:hypothetical protein